MSPASALDRTPAGPVRAVLALGANLGDRRATLQAAVDELHAYEGIRVTAVSRLYETDPVGGPEQPDYLNAVILVETTESPLALLAACQQVEQDHRRERVVRWGPRTLDIDVVVYGDVVLDTQQLTLPHPRAAERAFVLVPWKDVDPDAELPAADGGAPVPVRRLAKRAKDAGGLRRAAEDPLVAPR